MKYINYLAGITVSIIALGWNNIAVAEQHIVLTPKPSLCNVPAQNHYHLNARCDRLKSQTKSQTKIADVPQPEALEDRDRRRSRTARSSRNKDLGGYVGATLGVFFPDLDESAGFFRGGDTEVDDAAIGGSLFAGIRFNRFLATDLELGGFAGDVDSDLGEDESYTLGALFLNPRFILPLDAERNSIALFLSPGIGVSQVTSTVEDEIDDFDRTTFIEDDTRFTWQLKGGVDVPVSEKFSVLGQVRYASQTGDDAIDYFATEVGVGFNF